MNKDKKQRIFDAGRLDGFYAGVRAERMRTGKDTLEVENAKLREQTRWMAQTDSRWEAAIRDLENAQIEIAKLRELVRDMWPHVRHRARYCDEECEHREECMHSEEPCLLYQPFERRMRELGVEVDE